MNKGAAANVQATKRGGAGGEIPQSRAIPYVWKWKEQERAELLAQLDAAYFHLYQLPREDVLYILSTFQTTGATDQGKTIQPHSTAELILSYYDEYQT